MHYDRGKVQLQSKTGKDFTRQFPELWAPQIKVKEAIFDEEVTVFTEGKPDFEATMERYMAKPKDTTMLMNIKPAVYIIWDIIWYEGNQVTDLPLLERKQLLDESAENNDSIRKIDWFDTKGLALWDGIKYQGLEGMVAKKKNSRYSISKRSPAWVKVKNFHETEVNILGYSRKDGTVLVGLGNTVQGHAIGMNYVDRVILKQILDQFGEEGKNGVAWLPLGARAIVKYTTLTLRGNMRDCSWVRFNL